MIKTHVDYKNLLLLEKSYSINEHMDLVEKLLMNHHVFSSLYKLEESIQPVLTSIEENGLVIATEWFASGLQAKHDQLAHVGNEINQQIESPDDEEVDEVALRKYWCDKDLPLANGFDSLKKYKNLHPTFQLMMNYKNHQNYLKMWGERLKEKGVLVTGGILIKGDWQSFTSYTGRITAKNLPLTSMPIAMRDYVVSPEGYEVVSLDLDNAELRFLAYYARCNSLMHEFNSGVDVHKKTAQLIQKNIDNYEVNEEKARELAKRYTFSFLYGASMGRITKNLQKVFKEITSLDVANINESFIKQYPEIYSFLLERERSPSLLTPFGEVEPIAIFGKAQKRNFTLQSSVSVAIKILMTILFKHGIKVTHVLHDEVWILVPDNVNFDNLISKPSKQYKEKIQSIFPGLPMKGLLSKDIIGGKNNE